MMAQPTIAAASEAEADQVTQRLIRFNIDAAGEPETRPVRLSLKDGTGELRGGLVAATSKNVLAIDVLYIDPELRGHGYGERLLAEAEARGREMGCNLAILDTFSWQAEGFYRKQGYAEAGRIEDCPSGAHRIYMVKRL